MSVPRLPEAAPLSIRVSKTKSTMKVSFGPDMTESVYHKQTHVLGPLAFRQERAGVWDGRG